MNTTTKTTTSVGKILNSMKSLILLLLVGSLCSCSTVKQAQTDFVNFQKTIKLNANAPVVYKNAYF
jgi:hypothetical protein